MRWAQERPWTGIGRPGLPAALPLGLRLRACDPCVLQVGVLGYEMGCLLARVMWKPALMKGCCYSLVAKLCLTLMDCSPQATRSTGFPTQKYWISCHSLLQGIFPTQGWNLYLLHWQVGSVPLSQQPRLRKGIAVQGEAWTLVSA